MIPMVNSTFFENINKILFTNVRVVDPENLSDKMQDVVIEGGMLQDMDRIDPSGFTGRIVDLNGRVLCPGLIDMHVHFREPGYEHKETIQSGSDAALAGGITTVCPMPNTKPAADSPQVIEMIKSRAEDLLIDVFPIAAVSKDRAGHELTDMDSLVTAGAVAFSDDGDPVATAGLLLKAFKKANELDVPIIEHCEDKTISEGWAMNEGPVAKRLGYKGIPGVAEEIIVARDIQLAELTGGKVHIAHISTAKSVDLVRQAKKRGVKVTCEVTPHHFTLDEKAVEEYGTNAKMSPPLRTRNDVDAILEGLRDGTIDSIATDHAPHTEDEKAVGFSQAPMGIVGLETALGLVVTQLVEERVLTLPQAICKMTKNPADILKIDRGKFRRGSPASLTIFDPAEKWTVDKKLFKSKSKNTPFDKWHLRGRVFGVYNKGQWMQCN